uniref:Uncharacterized protein n=1 Tax=Anguilla anguilla TaxID=7936 RepID=A0A0E9XIY5_ANGAN
MQRWCPCKNGNTQIAEGEENSD